MLVPLVSLSLWYLYENSDLQVEEGKLARVAAVFVHKSTGEITAKDGAEIIVRYLAIVSAYLIG